MKNIHVKKLGLLLGLVMFSQAIQAESCGSDCKVPVYECACNPLYCGAKSLQLNLGIAPIDWRNRGEIDLLSCSASATNPVVGLGQLPKYSSVYQVPWLIGVKLGFAFTDNIELYLEGNYLQGSRKNRDTGFVLPIANIIPAQSLVIVLGHYSLFDAYIGGRYYWDRWCNKFSPFMGLQFGFTAHRKVRTTITNNTLTGAAVVITPAVSPSCVPIMPVPGNASSIFGGNTVFSGGLNLGFDYCLGCNWAFVFTFEFIGSCGPKAPPVSVFGTQLPAPILATNLIVGGIGVEMRFPLTAGLKYNF